MAANDTDKQGSSGFAAGIFVGAVLGAGLAYILSRDDKNELKKQLKDKAKLVWDNLSDFTESAEDAGREIVDKVDDERKLLAEKLAEKSKLIEDEIQTLSKQAETVRDQIDSVAQNSLDDVAKFGKSTRRFFSKRGHPVKTKKS